MLEIAIKNVTYSKKENWRKSKINEHGGVIKYP